MSMASSDRKNQENYGTNRKKIGRKGDGVFRLKGSRLEFGAIETGREWEGEHGKKACNPQSVEPDLALNLEIADLINQKKQNYPRDAAMHIVRLVNHRNPTVAWLALTLLDICVKNCGYPFHLQIATKEFLNELVRKFPEKSPAIPNPIQLKILEFIQEWKITICTTSRHKDDLTLKSPEELEEEDRVAQAAVEGRPSDLAEANELMKIMSGYNQEAKPDYKKQANEELENIQQKAILLNDMLNNVKSSEETSKGDIFEELIQSCKTSQPKIQKMISEEEDSESIDRLLTLNDLINTVLTRYENILKGIFDQPKELNQQSILQPKAKEETKTNNSDSWLIDLSEPEPEPQLGQIRITSNPTTTTSSSSSTNEPALYNSTSSNKGFSHWFNLKNQNNTTFVENFPLMSPTTITKQSL
nr:9760_t:CDS:10 [Entrophospora candida]